MPFFHQKHKVHLARLISCCLLSMQLFNIVLSTPAHAESAAETALDSMETLSFSEETSSFTNPDRGWWISYSTNSDLSGLASLREQGISIILLKANLKEFVDGPISEFKLAEINNAFAIARQSGLQVLFRAAYDFDGVKACEPKELSIITGHIAQLKDIFYRNEDVLYSVQAGFLGPWGEWHSSFYGSPPSLEARTTVLKALMTAVPKSRTIQVRRPMFIRDIYPGQEITEATAFNGSDLSRTGYHNDAVFSSSSDDGTYVDPNFTRQDELSWASSHTKFTSFSGESNSLFAYSDPNNAVNEFEMLHVQTFNTRYHPDVIAKWKSTSYNGTNTYDYISARLGYRFVIQDAKISTQLSKGGVLHLNINIENKGFGNMFNYRPFEIVLSNGQTTYTAKVSDDVRKWYREKGVLNKDLYFSIPSGIGSGSWNVYLNIPSASSGLRNKAAYSVRLANKGVFDTSTGYNLIKGGLAVGSETVSNTVASFEQISRAQALVLAGNNSSPAPTETLQPEPTATPQLPPANTQPPVSPAEMPTSATPTVPEAASGVNALIVMNDAKNLYLKASGNDLNQKGQFFLNTDNNTATGYKYQWDRSGFEYMIENNRLYKYAGRNNAWKWTKVRTLVVVKSDTEVTAVVPFSAVKTVIGRTIQSGYICNDDPNNTFPRTNQPLVSYKIVHYIAAKVSNRNIAFFLYGSDIGTLPAVYSMTLTNDTENLYFNADGNMLNVKSQFFLNTDNNSTTGYKYKWSRSGFEYLIENNTLYRYTGTNNEWKWSKIQTLSVIKTDLSVRVSLPLSLIGLSAGKTVQAGFISNDNMLLVCPELSAALTKYLIK